MKKTVVEFTVKTMDGKHYVKEDSNTMEVHDAVDYLVLKYVTKGGRIAALPVKFVTEMGREQNRVDEEKTV